MVKHYGIIHWVDYARGLIDGEKALRMRKHLAGGCEECGVLADFCNKVMNTASGMLTSPPDRALDLVRAIFPVRSTTRPRRSALIPVQLMYDSQVAPAAAGLRSSWQVGWQGLYHAGDCSLDLRIEPELNSSRAAVIGQITNHVEPQQDMGNTPVCLKAGGVVVAETISNKFGEFQMEYEQRERLQLCVYLEGGAKRIQIALKKRATDTPDDKKRLKLGGRRGPTSKSKS